MAGLGSRNPNVQRLRRLSRRRSSRRDEGLFVIEGPTLVAEALAAGVAVTEAFVDADAARGAGPAGDEVPVLRDRLHGAGITVHVLAPGVLAGATDTVTPQGLAVLARRPDRPAGTFTAPAPATAAPGDPPVEAGRSRPPLVLVLAGVADPGNAGTLIRSAEAAGATAVWAAPGSVDLFGPKAVRSSAGSLFHVAVAEEVEPGATAAALAPAGVRVAGTTARGGTPYDGADLTGPVALVLGSEAHGLPPAWAAIVDEWLTVPIVGRAESLNVAMAGTLLCFEAARQRRRSGSPVPGE